MARRILIVQSQATERIALKAMLGAAHYDVSQALTGAEALTILAGDGADLVLCDTRLNDMTGLQFCTALRRDGPVEMPPVLLLAHEQGCNSPLPALKAGALGLLSQPLGNGWLLAHIRSLLRARDTLQEMLRREATANRFGLAEEAIPFAGRGRVALVAGQSDDRVSLATYLRGALSAEVGVMRPAEALSQVSEAAAPDVILLPVDLLAQDDGLALLSELRSREATRHIGIVAMFDPARRDAGARALDLGANDLFELGGDPAELALRTGTRIAAKRHSDRLRGTLERSLRLAASDELTGLFNRRYALHHLAALSGASRAEPRQVGVMMIDIDRFKSVNDTYGHATGDLVLREVARRLRDNLRGMDLTARMGGEEFLVILPDTTPSLAHNTAERLRHTVSAIPVGLPSGEGLHVSVSIGVAVSDGSDFIATTLVDLADQALYRAKDGGRDRVVLAPQPPAGMRPPKPATGPPPPPVFHDGMKAGLQGAPAAPRRIRR